MIKAGSFNTKRCRNLTEGVQLPESGSVLYWMSRDQRVDDNWALLYAQKLAKHRKAQLYVVFCLVPKFLDATIRQYGFMLAGLQEVEAGLHSKNVPFILKLGQAKDEVPKLCKQLKVTTLVCDMSPLRVPQQWSKDVAAQCAKQQIACHQVDAHNVVPVWLASDKLEYAARTIRPKITKLLPEFLTEIPKMPVHPHPPARSAWPSKVDWKAAEKSLIVDRSVPLVESIVPGARAAQELVVRRELADNFCFYNDRYDQLEGCSEWAQVSLQKHAKDKREYVYSLDELQQGKTHDDLWNAAQLQMVREGKMHGFLRMYWAKKILEWSPTPKEALRRAIYLNDRYELDGRDPNGYVGCMWSIGGIHDMGWTERPIFGKIRFMNYAGCKRKFNIPSLVARYPEETENKKPAKRAKRG